MLPCDIEGQLQYVSYHYVEMSRAAVMLLKVWLNLYSGNLLIKDWIQLCTSVCSNQGVALTTTKYRQFPGFVEKLNVYLSGVVYPFPLSITATTRSLTALWFSNFSWDAEPRLILRPTKI